MVYMAFMFIIPLAGEFQFYPLAGEFRVSFATPVFLLALLFFRQINPFLAGLLTGFAVIALRFSLALYTGIDWQTGLVTHLPVFMYYSTYGFLFSFIPIDTFKHKPHYIGFFACCLEIGSSMAEVIARSLLTGLQTTPELILTILVVAVIRNFFVMGIYMLFLYHDLLRKAEIRSEKHEQTLSVISDLFVEMTQLKKSIDNAEKNTAECFRLSRDLRGKGEKELSESLMNMSGKVHENKKDAQRIYASLSKLIHKQEYQEIMTINDILHLVEKLNLNYAQHLKKSISFHFNTDCSDSKFQSYLLLSILNNLVANAIEAADHSAVITISVSFQNDNYLISVEDNGPGIPFRDQAVIFSPGYTTKFSYSGVASNGIGLAYIKNVIEQYNGSISLMSSVPYERTCFHIVLPDSFSINES